MRWTAALAGLIATAAAVTVLVSLSQAPTGEAAPPTPEPQPETVNTTPELPPTTETITVEVPEQPIRGLEESISDALIASGYTEFVGESELGSELDPAVARVLSDEDAVLVIADEAGEG